MDILRMFPDVPNAKDSGFAFRMDVSDLIIRQGYRQGLHYLKIPRRRPREQRRRRRPDPGHLRLR